MLQVSELHWVAVIKLPSQSNPTKPIFIFDSMYSDDREIDVCFLDTNNRYSLQGISNHFRDLFGIENISELTFEQTKHSDNEARSIAAYMP